MKRTDLGAQNVTILLTKCKVVDDMMPAGKLGQIICGIFGCIILWELLVSTAAAKVRMRTYAYKRVGDREIKANVYRSDDAKVRPVVVWIHGGALIMGGRDGVMGHVKKEFLDAVIVCKQWMKGQ